MSWTSHASSTTTGPFVSKVGLSECAARVAPLVAARGDAGTPVFETMDEASAVSAAAVGTAAYKNAEGMRVLVSWALEALRPSLFEKGSRAYMPVLVAPQQEPAEEPTPQEAYKKAVPASKVNDTRAPPQQSQEDATPAQQHESARAAGREQLAATTATQSGGASKTSAPAAAQRAHAAEAKQREENKKVVELVQSSTIPREVCERGLSRMVHSVVFNFGVCRVSAQRCVSVGCLVWFCWSCLLLVSRVVARILAVFPLPCVRLIS